MKNTEIDGQPAERTITVQLERLQKKNPDIEDIVGELNDVADNIMYYIDHLEDMLAPYYKSIPTANAIKEDLKIIRKIL